MFEDITSDEHDPIPTSSPLEITLENFSEQSRSEWRPSIIDVALRSEVMANRRLRQRIASDIALSHGIDLGKVLDLGDEHSRIEGILKCDLGELEQVIGAAWHATQVAEIVTAGTLSRYLHGFSSDMLRTALSVGPTQLVTAVAPDALMASIKKTGRAALSAWVASLPDAAIERFCLLTDFEIVWSFPDEDRHGLIEITRVVLDAQANTGRASK